MASSFQHFRTFRSHPFGDQQLLPPVSHLCCVGHAPAGGVDSGFRFVWDPATGWDVTDEADWFHMDVNSQEETDAKSYLQVH